MTNQRSLGDLLHDATHRVPGVPGHRDHDPGHQGRSRPAAGPGRAPAAEPNGTPANRLGDKLNHRPTNQGEPRVLVGWQRRVAAFFGHR